ncbi:glutamate 5-kinase, partial [Escherichia coli]|nr:glutamate 5-kinase [Escherichia coli]
MLADGWQPATVLLKRSFDIIFPKIEWQRIMSDSQTLVVKLG